MTQGMTCCAIWVSPRRKSNESIYFSAVQLGNASSGTLRRRRTLLPTPCFRRCVYATPTGTRMWDFLVKSSFERLKITSYLQLQRTKLRSCRSCRMCFRFSLFIRCIADAFP